MSAGGRYRDPVAGRATVHWALVLHFYQPPTQTHAVLRRIVDESYRPLLAVLRGFPGIRVGININGVLAELLHDHGCDDVLATLRELGERGTVEFLGSAKFHPILPLIPDGLRRRAINENASTNRERIGPGWEAGGFFLPELAFSPDVLPAVVGSGHRWLLLSGAACPDGWPEENVPVVIERDLRLPVLFRDDARSNRIAFGQTSADAWIKELAGLAEDGRPRYVVTALDAETFGHHIQGWQRTFLAAVFGALSSHDGIRLRAVAPGDIVRGFPEGPSVRPRSSSWSTSGEDIAAGNPFPLWRAPGNAVHELQWEYVDLCCSVIETACRQATGAASTEFGELAAATLQPALHSCQFWWASRRPWWGPIMVQRGLALLTQALLYGFHAVAVSSLPDEVKREVRWKVAAADDIRIQIERQLFGGTEP